MPADWQLPVGVSRGLWDYLHDPAVARDYDARLSGTSLFEHDQKFVLEHCGPPGRIIDLGCGTGRLALLLTARGYRVLAVDLSEEMLKVVGEKTELAGIRVDRLQANLVELECVADRSFDHAACLFSTLGMIVGQGPRLKFLVHVHRLLRPGGVFVLHVHNRWFHLGTRAGRRLLLRHFWDRCRGRAEAGDFAMPPHQGLGNLIMHLFTCREIVGLLRKAGFQIVEVRPLSLNLDGRVRAPWFFGRLRAYGYLIAARKQ